MRSLKSSVLFVFLTSLYLASTSLSADPRTEYIVAFNHDEKLRYFESYRNIEREGSNFEALILQLIESAQRSLDVAVHEIRIPSIAKALAQKKRQGIEVRVIVENQYNQSLQEIIRAYDKGELSESDFRRFADYIYLADRDQNGKIDAREANEADAIAILRNAELSLKDDTADGSKGSGLMHHKFIVIDGSSVLVTSANFTLSDIHGDLSSPESRGNWNALVHLPSPELARSFQEEFNIMYGHIGDVIFPEGPPRFGVKKPYRRPSFSPIGTHGKVAVQFSPVSTDLPWEYSTNGVIARVLRQAKSQVDAALFVFSDQNLAYTLEELHEERNIPISFVIDSRFAFQYYSEGLDMLGLQMLNGKCVYEDGNSPWANPIRQVGRANLEAGDLLHHKFAVVDQRFTLFGSHNWSESANDINDENLLIIDSPEVAKRFEEEISRIHKRTTWGIPAYVEEKIYERERGCF